MIDDSGPKVIQTVCGLNDYFRCGLSIELANGEISRVRPYDYPDPADRGVCAKGLAVAGLVNSPERLQYPLRRAGERGSGQWERISWDEALDDIAAGMLSLSGKYGPTAVAWASPVLPSLNGGGYSRIISLMGASWVDWWGCGDAAGPCADITTFGTMMGEGYLSRVPHPKLSLIWGYNPAVTVYHYMKKIDQARKQGCRVVTIDPRYSETAARADQHVYIRPGTDTALALGMMNVIIQEGLQDEGFIRNSTIGPLLVRDDNGSLLRESDVSGKVGQGFMVYDSLAGQVSSAQQAGTLPALRGRFSLEGLACRPAYDLLVEVVQEYTPDLVAGITGIEERTVRDLAVSYASEKPAAIYRGWGIQRTFYGDLASRAVNALAAITGNMYLNRPAGFVLNSAPFLFPAGQRTRLPLLALCDAAVKGEPFPVKGLWCSGHNLINQMPNANRIMNELLPNLELFVVSDLFMTVTAQYADYVLPAASFLESTDLCMGSFQNTYLQLQRKVVEPLHESKSDFQIACALGRKLGLGQYFNKSEEEYMIDLLASDHPSMAGVNLDRLRQGPVMATMDEKPPQLRTMTGRVEFYSETLREFGQELPRYIEPVESARTEKAKRYPLSLISAHPGNRIHSTLAKVPKMAERDPEAMIDINEADARERNISNGDVVSVYNDLGRVVLRARISAEIMPGVVNVLEGWWPEHYVEGHINQLTHDLVNPVQQRVMQANSAFFDVLVQVEKAPK